MTVELLHILSLAAYIAAGVFLLASIALFFLFEVPKLYGDVSGRTARKAINAIRRQNEASGNKAYKPSVVNEARGKLTEKITQSGRLVPQTAGMPIHVGTEKFDTSMLAPQYGDISESKTPARETSVLDMGTHETTVLTGELCGLPNSDTTVLVQKEFSIDVEMNFTGSGEVIE